MIPRMHKDGFGSTLRKYARAVGPGNAIVEVGSWMGASAQFLAEAAGYMTELHLYDRWRANSSEVMKLKGWGVEAQIGEDLLPFCKKNVEGYGTPVHFHRGDIREAKYNGKMPIGLYVDDASKNNLEKVLKNFEPYFVPGCVLILCDYFYLPCERQRTYVENRQGWELLARDEHDSNAAIWRIRGGTQ